MGFCRNFQFKITIFAASAALPFLIACGSSSSSDSSSSVTPQIAEVDYNATPISYSGSTMTITATATFDRYIDGDTGLATIESGLPIRYAETHILDSSGKLVQAGETDGNGSISMIIPLSSSNYTLRVNSRAFNSYYKISVLQDPYSNAYYSLDTSFTANGTSSQSVSISPASATNGSNLLGGAFNILDQIYLANQFLRSNAYSSDCPVCLNDFSVAPKAQLYWKKGVSPAVYYGASTTPLSFFLPVYSGGVYPGLYILGGIEGDVCTDTDHFDRSVILHEYGHFLEKAYGKSASPGGSHNGNDLIDPRLAWSEGWADFFQAAVLGRNYYRDTVKNAACTGGNRLAFADFDLEARSTNDVPATNEGIFREISIARTMYDMMTSVASPSSHGGYSATPQYSVTAASDNKSSDSYAANLGFSLIWNGFTGMGNSAYKFQNMGLLNTLSSGVLAANTSTYGANSGTTRYTAYSDILSYERQASTQALYGSTLTPQNGATCSYNFLNGGPVSDDKDSRGNILWTDPLRTNDYYRYDYDGSSANGIITLTYARSSGTLATYDLDLYVYYEKHTLLDSSDLAGFSEASQTVSATSGSESVDLRGKPAGTYMINVKVYYQGARADTNYYLETSSGVRLCP